jgi:O-acetyl-ADP-ribose deacetylase (regulator of RNase III)
MTPITYLKGDATSPQGEGYKLIAHICNNVGAWGAGFVLALSARSGTPEFCYRMWAERFIAERKTLPLGDIQTVPIDNDTAVVNMIAQEGVYSNDDRIPLRYVALAMCLVKLRQVAQERAASVHMPRIGCGLAGGRWDKVEPLIISLLCKHDVSVFVYDL